MEDGSEDLQVFRPAARGVRVSVALSRAAQRYDLNVLRGYILETIWSQEDHEGQNERDREDDAGYRSIVRIASEHDNSTRSLEVSPIVDKSLLG